jgi:hypothetical protein
MSERGRRLFDKYVEESLSHPDLAVLGLESHVHLLISDTMEAGISTREIAEEVGPLVQAITKGSEANISRHPRGKPPSLPAPFRR